MTQEQKDQLFPLFAFFKSKELDPEKYAENDPEKWNQILSKNPEDADKLAQMAAMASDED
jgi:hypothetical protein